jgi:hypothetical protein
MKLYQFIASTIDARERTGKFDTNNEWYRKHCRVLELIEKGWLPSGSGIDNGCKLNLDESNMNKIVIEFSYHHMNDNGFYDGWTEHKITITPDLVFDISLKITGKNINDIKDYFHEVFQHNLTQEVSKEEQAEVYNEAI